jgi:tripartite-type tricarboxylate transporter receptor subunit TctC
VEDEIMSSNSKRRSLLKAMAGATALSVTGRAFAAYPERAIRLVVPFAPGGNADLMGRLLGEGLSQALGQPVVVENKAGAGGSIGAAEVARAAPDGYTLLVGSNGPLTVNPFVQAKLGYDPLKDLAAVGMMSITPHSLVVNAGVPAHTVREIVALSQKQQVGIGTSGIGSATHLTLERFNAQTGAKLLHVPYKGGGALLPDLVSGTIQGAMTEFSSALPYHRGGKARYIAVASTSRSQLAPDVPTMIESGVSGFTAGSFIGVLAPAGTPADVMRRLEEGLSKTLTLPKTLQRIQELGGEAAAQDVRTPAGFAAFIRQDYERSGEAAKLAGLKKE